MQEEQLKFCQSCSMPMTTGDLHGTEADGSKSEDYCGYCYHNGAFTVDIDLEGMIEICLPPMIEAHPEMSPEEAKAMLETYMPQLKRWKKD